MLSESQLANVAAKVKNGAYSITRVADALTFEDAVRLTDMLSNQNGIALMDIYRRGLSRQPGFLVKARFQRGDVLTMFIQGVSTESEAEGIIRARYSNKDPQYFRITDLHVERVGVWPESTTRP